jgi:serine protease inhibitor
MTVPVLMGVEHWVDPSEQPKDRHTLQQYDIDEQVLVAPEIQIHADRPFAFVVHDPRTRTPLFLGQVADPAA